ncbi:hypothetical protein F3D3_4776 [Fusibacter sp. 3D3]|nr:hypothetical protein F3D3_4776 [Fusibacter sp. 3D3]
MSLLGQEYVTEWQNIDEKLISSSALELLQKHNTLLMAQ